MVRKLIILGIDGMDWDVIVRYKDKLPNLYGLMQKNNYPHLALGFPGGYNSRMVHDLYWS